MERTINIVGMTCAACEQTVADAALACGATSAMAHARTGTLVMTGDALPTDGDLTRALANTPYALGHRAWLTKDRPVWRDVAIAVVVVTLAAVAFAATGAGDALQNVTRLATSGSLVFIVMLGVTASVSTCMALVGGLVMSIAASAPPTARLRPHLAFNAGRILGFAALGALVGGLGQAVAPSGTALSVAMIAVAVVMGLLGLRLTGLSPRLAAAQFSLPASWGGWARRTQRPDGMAGSGAAAGLARPAVLGAATFFLPCGFTQAVQVMALTTGSPTRGALIMGAFALGTTPGLLAAATASSAARTPKAAPALRAIGVLVLAFSVTTASGALHTLFPGLAAEQISATARTSNVTDIAGTQRATVEIVAGGYSPASTVVYVGETVEWVVDPQVISCASLITARELGVADFNAIDGAVTTRLTIKKPGTYSYGCRMGMYSGTITAIERPPTT
ncbi:sulfite exporter TauE/SafE family protein [Demequina sp.]|uniref:urease accessory protein UreH domain-containing protein n=1 Tax=Demequina sp. TaxID=2050685 RepID=UPI003D1191E9